MGRRSVERGGMEQPPWRVRDGSSALFKDPSKSYKGSVASGAQEMKELQTSDGGEMKFQDSRNGSVYVKGSDSLYLLGCDFLDRSYLDGRFNSAVDHSLPHTFQKKGKG
ncbi:unnamed protein product [Leuciscus chuanchicus]